MSSAHGHKHTGSMTQNHKAQLANAYNELGKELSSTKVKVVGNYTLGKIIGEGAYGKVRLGTHRLTSTRVAVKQIPKAVSSSLTREIHHHRQLHHPHVTQMYEVLATESSIWIVTELCSGGELFDYLAEKGRIGEEETRILFGQLCLAVAYLHEKGIVHRDLKLENILLDERCRIKLGDFGFTREFERGSFMETFCGTTGYASPEMLQGKKYQGPEVDVWSLGVILYCLLTGTLPFDDDNEGVMRDKIIKGDFEDPEWLSADSRDLIKKILQKDPANRLTIRQILSHVWFVAPPNPPIHQSTLPQHVSLSPSPESFQLPPLDLPSDMSPLSPSASSIIPAFSEFNNSTSANDITQKAFDTPKPNGAFSHFDSNETPTKAETFEGIRSWIGQPTTDQFDQIQSPQLPAPSDEDIAVDDSSLSHPFPRATSGPKPPPAYSVRTPVRTKRRSVSSNLSDPASPTVEKFLPPVPYQDFAALLNTPAPIIFSTPLERNLLTSLSTLGFDTAQIVHSVLSDACDAAGAVWWMLKRKAEKKSLETGEKKVTQETSDRLPSQEASSSHLEGGKRGVSVQTDGASPSSQVLSATRSAPQLAFVPPTPTLPRPETPPKSRSSAQLPLLSPSPGSSSRSHPSTPAGSLRDKDGSKARRDGKVRSGSVSIMQRATTALEAAGLVRKRSVEAVRDDREKEKEREREKSKESERRVTSGEEPRSSHGSGSSRLTKSTYSRSAKDPVVPSTPPSESRHSQTQVGSPWVVTEAHHSPPNAPAPTPANSPIPSRSGLRDNAGKAAGTRHRASLLTAFRLWFNDDRKGKRKETNQSPAGGSSWTPVHNRPNSGTAKRRTSGQFASRKVSHRAHRPSVSSRRSSSANSRRSSAASAQIILLDPPHIIEQLPTRRSIGSHTPNSERGEFSSRPSSVRSFSMQRHRKSPSASSAGSAHFRTASPMQKYHKRTGSGSSTRVVRQIQPVHNSGAKHTRSNSASSSIHTPASSRPASFYEPSEGDVPRTVSPFKRRSLDDNRKSTHVSNTTFVAQKRQAPFMSPGSHLHNSIGRSSWKKSWGLEPPGWQSRTAHVPIEVLAISPVTDAQSEIRDVFSGRKSLNLGDESDWVDEDDDIPSFAGGLGQMAASAPNSSSFGHQVPEPLISLSSPPRGHRAGKRANRNAGIVPAISTSRQKSAHSPVERVSPIPTENNYEAPEVRGGRRQLPSARSGPAFRHAIQEEDEGEEE